MDIPQEVLQFFNETEDIGKAVEGVPQLKSYRDAFNLQGINTNKAKYEKRLAELEEENERLKTRPSGLSQEDVQSEAKRMVDSSFVDFLLAAEEDGHDVTGAVRLVKAIRDGDLETFREAYRQDVDRQKNMELAGVKKVEISTVKTGDRRTTPQSDSDWKQYVESAKSSYERDKRLDEFEKVKLAQQDKRRAEMEERGKFKI